MEEKRLKTDLDEVRDIRRKRYLKRNKELNEKVKKWQHTQS
jgi:hypothetical protein